jgi:hypothetical protein
MSKTGTEYTAFKNLGTQTVINTECIHSMNFQRKGETPTAGEQWFSIFHT